MSRDLALPIKIYTLGRFEVLINGQPLGKNRKTPHRLMELLIAIMTYGGAPVSAARLMDMLWPEADGDQARENLKKSIARLRQLLAVDDALCWQDGEISLNRTCCWVDAWAFEASLGEGESSELQEQSSRTAIRTISSRCIEARS